MILDADGNVVVEQVVLPLHVAALPEVVRAVRRDHGMSIQPGDAYITNHPYLAGVTHSVDMAVVTPLFSGDRLVAFCGSIAHKSDLGGMVPGTGSGNAREIFQEGIQFPPVRYMRGGRIERDIESILRANSRTPELVLEMSAGRSASRGSANVASPRRSNGTGSRRSLRRSRRNKIAPSGAFARRLRMAGRRRRGRRVRR